MGEPAQNTNSEGQKSIFSDIGLDRSEYGASNSLRFKILTLVESGQYEMAISAFESYLGSSSPYPDFHSRVKRYVTHGMDLVYAIKAKRNFPGVSSLTRAKQQELREKFKEHFRELSLILRRIEKVEKDLKITDARSTIYVLRYSWYSVVGILFLFLWLELQSGLFKTFVVVIDEVFTQIVDFVFSKF